MEEKVLYSMESPFQQEINVKGYYFGKNEGKEHSACIVGALRGNEYQQLYICSKLIDVLKKIEKHGDIVGENGILVIPSVSNMSMDFGKRFWISDYGNDKRIPIWHSSAILLSWGNVYAAYPIA